MAGLSSKKLKEYLDKGYFHAIVTFEVVGKPKDHVVKTIEDYVAQLNNVKGLVVVDKERGEPESLDDGLFGVFYEVELLVPRVEDLVWIALNFTPASIEVLGPAKISLSPRDLTNWFNDLLSQLHEIGLKFKQVNASHAALSSTFSALLRNVVVSFLASGAKSLEDLSKLTGLSVKDLDVFVEGLVVKGVVAKRDGKYVLP